MNLAGMFKVLLIINKLEKEKKGRNLKFAAPLRMKRGFTIIESGSIYPRHIHVASQRGL